MSSLDLTFYKVSDGQRIFEPLLVTGSSVQVKVTNLGVEDLEDLGIYIVPSTSLGEVDNPADYPPETDYQDLLSWGTASHLGLAAQGGLKLTVPQNTGSAIEYVRRDAGAKYSNRISFADMAVDQSRDFTIDLEDPPGLGGVRRLFVNIVLE